MKTSDDLDLRLTQIAPSPGDVFLLHLPMGQTPSQVQEWVEKIHVWLEEHGRPDVLFVPVPSRYSVERVKPQHRDKTSNAVRIRHPASGAVGECQDSRSQDQNTRMAFRRLVASEVFKVWLDLEVHPDKLKVEIRKGGEWVTA